MRLATTPLGQHMRKLRVARGMALQDMAEGMGISSAHASRIELGKTDVTIEYIDKATSFFQLNETGKQALTQAANLFNVWNTRALEAYRACQFEDAVSFWGKAARASGTTKVYIAKALFNQATTLEHIRQYFQAIQTYEKILDDYGNDDDDEMQVVCANVLINKGVIFQNGSLPLIRKDTDEVLALYRELLRRYRDSDNTELRLLCAKALFNMGAALQQTDDVKAMEAFDKVVNNYGRDKGLEIRSECAKALFNKGCVFIEPGCYGKATEVWGSVVQRYDADDNADTRLLCAQTQFNIGFTFKKQEKHDQAASILQDMVTRYGRDDDTEVKNVLNAARQQLKSVKSTTTSWNTSSNVN